MCVHTREATSFRFHTHVSASIADHAASPSARQTLVLLSASERYPEPGTHSVVTKFIREIRQILFRYRYISTWSDHASEVLVDVPLQRPILDNAVGLS